MIASSDRIPSSIGTQKMYLLFMGMQEASDADFNFGRDNNFVVRT